MRINNLLSAMDQLSVILGAISCVWGSYNSSAYDLDTFLPFLLIF